MSQQLGAAASPSPSGSASPLWPRGQMCREWWPPVQCTIHTNTDPHMSLTPPCPQPDRVRTGGTTQGELGIINCWCRTTSKTGLKFPSQKETVSLLWKCEVWHKICYIQVTKSILLYGAVWCAVGLEGLLCLFSHKKSWSFHHQSILSLSLHNCAVNLTGLQRLYLKSFSKAWF